LCGEEVLFLQLGEARKIANRGKWGGGARGGFYNRWRRRGRWRDRLPGLLGALLPTDERERERTTNHKENKYDKPGSHRRASLPEVHREPDDV
jgi:hypothetical protein